LAWLPAVAAFTAFVACSDEKTTTTKTRQEPVHLRINEVVSRNEGVWVDEQGETDDYVELINAGSDAIDLGQYQLADSSRIVSLPG